MSGSSPGGKSPSEEKHGVVSGGGVGGGGAMDVTKPYREVLIIRPGRPVFFAVVGRFVAEVGPKTLLNGSGSISCC